VAVQFIIGRAGTGKTHRCLTSIAAALRADPLGPPIYWIVPKQATFMTERMLVCEVGAFCRARVVSFEQLGREIFAYAGGNVIPEVTPLGRQMVIGHLLRQLKPQLRFFAGSARQPGLAAELDAAFAEFERSGKSAAELGTLIDELELSKPVEVDQVSLLAKLRDLRLVYDAYAKFLGQEQLDQHQRLQQVLKCVDGCPPLRGATVYVDGFTEFSEHERKLLAGIAKVAARVEIMLLLDPTSAIVRDPHMLPDEDGLFHQTAQTFRRLWFTFAEENVVLGESAKLETPHRFVAPDLNRIEHNLVAATPATPASPASPLAAGVEDHGLPPGSREATQPSQPQDAVSFTVAPDRQSEVDAVARGIRKLWREGFRLRDIAILVRDVEPYHALIDASFREHGIAFFVDRRRSATHHPLLQFVRSLLQIVRYDWPNEAALALMKSGLALVTPAECDELENYVDDHRLRRGAWDQPEPWTYRRRQKSDDPDHALVADRPETVDEVRRRVVDRIRPTASLLRINEELTVRELAVELFAAVDRFGVRETLAAWAHQSAQDDPEQAAEHEQVWAEFVALCEQMVDLLGDERVSLADFVDILESGLERFDLAITPPTVDQVLVGQVDRTRCPPGLRATFVLGLNEGEFPRVSREPSVLTEPERREMRRRHVELDADSLRQLRDEDLLGYVAFTRAAERLMVSRPRVNDDARETSPSRLWLELSERFPDAPVHEIPQDVGDDVRFVETPRQVIGGLAHWVRLPPPCTHGGGLGRGSSAPADTTAPTSPGSVPSPLSPEYRGERETPWPTIYQWLAGYAREDDEIARMRRLAWGAIGYANDASLSADLAEKLFGRPLEVTARQVETFAACPFKHFVRYGLQIYGKAPTGVTGMDLSRVYHQVLDIVVGDVLEKHADWQQFGTVVSRAEIRSYSQAVGQQLRGELMLSTARNKYLLGRIERTLEEVVASQAEMMRRGQFRPAFTGVEFGETGRLPALRVTTPGGGEAVVRGSVDRVDLLPDGQHAAVFDYKMSAGALAMQDVYHGLSLQLLMYLLVLQASGEKLAGKPITPVAAMYLPLLRRMNDVDHPDEALDPDDPRFHLRVKPRGTFDADYLPAFDSSLDRGFSDVVSAFVSKDGTLGRRNSSDAADPAEFSALLAFVRNRIGELADGIVAGVVGVLPYRMNRETPCPRCEYRSVCRFEPSINRYNNLEPLRREDALARMSEGGSGGE
jgi:ATP-dependent helicase/nuclease subunit B